MPENIVFYTHPMSRGRIVRRMLEEIEVPYTTEFLEYGTTMKAPDYLAINPMGKVPAIKHGNNIVTECAAILAYLADAFPEANLAPPLDNRADYYRWLFFTIGPLEYALVGAHMEWTPKAGDEGMIGYGNLANVLDTLEQGVNAGKYITGDQFTAADILLGSNIEWSLHWGTLERRAAFEDYLGRIGKRPAWVRADDIDNQRLQEMQQGDQ